MCTVFVEHSSLEIDLFPYFRGNKWVAVEPTELITASTRFIPNREGQDLQASFSLLHEDASPTTPSRAKKRTPHGELHFQKSKFDGHMDSSDFQLLTLNQPKKPTGPSRLCFAPNYLTQRFPSPPHQRSLPIPFYQPQITPQRYMIQPDRGLLQRMCLQPRFLLPV